MIFRILCAIILAIIAGSAKRRILIYLDYKIIDLYENGENTTPFTMLGLFISLLSLTFNIVIITRIILFLMNLH